MLVAARTRLVSVGRKRPLKFKSRNTCLALERCDLRLSSGEGESAEAPGRLHRSERAQGLIPMVKIDARGNIDITDAIAIGHAKGFVVEIVADPPESAARHAAFARVHEGHPPRLGKALVDFHGVVQHVEGDIRHVQEIIGEVFLDEVALVSAADDEVIHAMRGILFHDVPEYGPPADLDKRIVRLQGNARLRINQGVLK